jgi:hypothetical protein
LTDDRAFGADDVASAYNRQMLRKLRFLMTDNTGQKHALRHPKLGKNARFSGNPPLALKRRPIFVGPFAGRWEEYRKHHRKRCNSVKTAQTTGAFNEKV